MAGGYTSVVFIVTLLFGGVHCEHEQEDISDESLNGTESFNGQSVEVNPRILGPGDPSHPFRVKWYTGEANRRLRCEAWGDPMPNITWYTDLGLGGLPSQHAFDVRKMKKLKAVDENKTAGWSEVSFAKVYLGLEGNYYCYAKNDKGVANRLYHVVVTDRFQTVTIVAGAVAGVIMLLLLAALIILTRKLIIHKRNHKAICKEEEDQFRAGDERLLNASEDYIGSAQVLIQAQPYNAKYEIPREKIICYNHLLLGTGEFGIVVQGAVQDSEGRMIHAAVKTTRSNVDLDYFRALLSEVKIMSLIGKHPNIVNLIGACTGNIRKNELLVAVEYCQKGNLRDFMRENREGFTDLTSDGYLNPVGGATTEAPGKGISTIELIRWSSEVAKGMEFLASKNIIHADLACRNILLTTKMVAKICDFGLSRQLMDYTNYVKKQQGPLPWKWMAIESLKDMHFSVQSDVWAYGIVLWEIYSLGEVPYPGQSWSHDFLKALINGERLPIPGHSTKSIYEVMLACWNEDPRSRPEFLKLKNIFEDLLAEIAGRDYMDVMESDYKEMALLEKDDKVDEEPAIITADGPPSPAQSPFETGRGRAGFRGGFWRGFAARGGPWPARGRGMGRGRGYLDYRSIPFSGVHKMRNSLT